ncbi:caspase-8 isoform X2 [Nilaparvata lugens]|nr:caspase-8 isoform X2 [Nilaparvata lugens]XP_039280808.1 caspase-8 isoform X2 [Nilaparvata lugens]
MDPHNEISSTHLQDPSGKQMDYPSHGGKSQENYCSIRFSQEKLTENITLDVIELVEKDMDFNDIVSLLFLVSEEQHSKYIFQRIAQFIKIKSANLDSLESVNYSLLLDWCLSNPKNWRMKIVEALGIIECFDILSKLGYKKIDVMEHFLPDDTEFAICIPLLKKKLYIELSNSPISEILSLYECLEKDGENSNDILFQDSFINKNYFEFLLIYLSSETLVRFDDHPDLKFFINLLEKANLLKLKHIFENYLSEHENLSEHCKTNENLSESSPGYNKPYTKDSSSIDEMGKEEFGRLGNAERIAVAHDDSELSFYKIGNPEDLGICLIINQKNFTRLRERDPKYQRVVSENLLVDRHGTERDVERLQETFKHFKVSVIVENDVPHSMIGSCIKDTIDTDFKQHHSVFFLVILSHGDQGIIYGVDSIPIAISSLVDAVLRSYDKLKNIPKVIIVQACQGNLPNPVLETDGGSCAETVATQPKYTAIGSEKQDKKQEKVRTAYHDDLLMCFSSVSGYESYRHTREGSKYIQILCDNLMKYGHNDDFLSICTRVNNDLKKLYVPIKIDDNVLLPSTQVSETSSCLHKKLFLVQPWRSNVPTYTNRPIS